MRELKPGDSYISQEKFDEIVTDLSQSIEQSMNKHLKTSAHTIDKFLISEFVMFFSRYNFQNSDLVE